MREMTDHSALDFRPGSIVFVDRLPPPTFTCPAPVDRSALDTAVRRHRWQIERIAPRQVWQRDGWLLLAYPLVGDIRAEYRRVLVEQEKEAARAERR